MSETRSLFRGAAAGLVGGLAASWVMNQFQAALSKATGPAYQESQAPPAEEAGRVEDDENATVKAATRLSRATFGRTLTGNQKAVAGPAVHYLFGSAVGALYGALAETAPRTVSGWGLPFGTALWLGADEIAVPAFGLSGPPTRYPISTHASALAAHLVYAATTEGVRRAVRKMI